MKAKGTACFVLNCSELDMLFLYLVYLAFKLIAKKQRFFYGKVIKVL